MNDDAVSMIIKRGLEMAKTDETWEGHFRLRSKELECLFSLYKIGRIGRLLELGCGNAFSSAIFARKARSVIATDLANYDLSTHSIGLEKAKDLLKRLNVANCLLAACSGDEIPFRDCSFDAVFSMYVLEHIKDKKAAVKEIRRVLKEGGIAITMVPNFMERVFYPLAFYKHLFTRALEYLKRSIRASHVDGGEARGVKSIAGRRSLKESYPSFPFPPPHGAYKNYSQELASHMPFRWKALFESSGMEIVSVFSTMIIPWNLLTLVGNKVPLFVYERTFGLNKLLGRLPVIKYLGNNLTLIARRKDD